MVSCTTWEFSKFVSGPWYFHSGSMFRPSSEASTKSICQTGLKLQAPILQSGTNRSGCLITRFQHEPLFLVRSFFGHQEKQAKKPPEKEKVSQKQQDYWNLQLPHLIGKVMEKKTNKGRKRQQDRVTSKGVGLVRFRKKNPPEKQISASNVKSVRLSPLKLSIDTDDAPK